MGHKHRALSIGFTLLPFFWATPARAQATTIAKKLLEEARNLKENGKIAEACPLLDRSYELDAKDGVLFARADCRDAENKIATAVGLYQAYLRAYSRMTGATKENHAERAAHAEERIKVLTPRVPMIKFVWAETPPSATTILVDGSEYRAFMLENLLPLEPGTHVVVVRIPGEVERQRTLTLTEGSSTIVDLTPLPPTPTAPKPVDLQKLLPIFHPPSSPPPVVVPPRGVDRAKVGGFLSVAMGVSGIVGGAVAGKLAITEKQLVDTHCRPNHRCDKTGIDAADRFQTLGNVSTTALVIGGISATIGATLLVVAYRSDRHARSTTRLWTTWSPGSAQAGVEGTF